MSHRADGFDGAARATQLEQVLDERAVLARKLASGVRRFAVGERLDLHPERAADVRLAATKAGAVQALEDRHLGAGRQLPGLDDLRDRPDRRRTSRHSGDEQDQVVAVLCGGHRSTLGVALNSESRGHARHDDDVVELQDRKEFGGQFGHFQSL